MIPLRPDVRFGSKPDMLASALECPLYPLERTLELISTSPCALPSVPQIGSTGRQAEELPTKRRSLTGGASAIGGRISNLKVDLGLHCGCPRHPHCSENESRLFLQNQKCGNLTDGKSEIHHVT